MSFELRPLVAEAKSLASTSATRIPRNAASRKTEAPVMPPPMTSRSNFSAASWRKINGRERLLKLSSAMVGDEHVVDRVAAGLDVWCVEAAIVEHSVVDVGRVVVGFVTDVTARESVCFGREAISNQHAGVFEILTQPREMAQRLRLRQPTRETDEECEIEWSSLFELVEQRLVRDVAAMERETNTESLRASGQLFGDDAMRVEVSGRQVDALHRLRIAARDFFERSK